MLSTLIPLLQHLLVTVRSCRLCLLTEDLRSQLHKLDQVRGTGPQPQHALSPARLRHNRQSCTCLQYMPAIKFESFSGPVLLREIPVLDRPSASHQHHKFLQYFCTNSRPSWAIRSTASGSYFSSLHNLLCPLLGLLELSIGPSRVDPSASQPKAQQIDPTCDTHAIRDCFVTVKLLLGTFSLAGCLSGLTVEHSSAVPFHLPETQLKL